MLPRAERCAVAALLFLLAPAVRAQDLVTPVRVGRPDAPLTLNVWAQQDYSHVAARPAIKDAFTVVLDDWARAHPDVQLRVSVMPGLEMHKAKLQLAAAAGRLPDVASIDSFWLPLLANDVQPLEAHWPAEDRRDFLPYNAGRWEATVFDHLAMFWAQGGELVDREGRPIFGEGPNRRAMLRVLGFLRDTIARGASPRSVLGHNDYQQLTAAAVAGDVAMFLGGNWQLKDLQSGLAPAEFAKWDIAPIPQADAATRSTGTGGWVWVVFARDPERRRAASERSRRA
jgi:ABC-type glycerol-3-phosphate transport system substrate-binding protein